MKFISFRRHYLDIELNNIRKLLNGKVLDVGGKRDNRRGQFDPSSCGDAEWIFLNNDKSSNPDIVAELPSIPLPNNSIDVVVCTEVIEYIYDYQFFIKEVNRVLDKNGIFILSSPFMSPFHADQKYDYYRFTESLVRRELSIEFSIVSFQRMGGVISVTYDLVRSYFSYQVGGIFSKIFLKALLMFSPFFILLDKYLFKNNYYVNTGFFTVARKEGKH